MTVDQLPRELTTHECLELLGTTRLGRLARNDPSGPVVVPVNFVVTHGGVLVRSLPGAKVEAASREEVVSFQADGIDERHRSGWSVLVRGELQVLDEVPQDLPDPDSFTAGDDDVLLWLDPDEVTGRRLPLSPAAMRSWEEVTAHGNVWFDRDGSDLLG